MKKFITILLVTLTLLFNTSTPTIAENPPPQVGQEQNDKTSGSLKFTVLHSFSSSDDSKINILSAENNLYITTCTTSTISVNNFKLIKFIPASSKVLVNRNNSLPKGYVPTNLTNISPKKIKLQYANLKLIPKTMNALYSMSAAAQKSNVKLFIINSAYRNENTQREIFNNNLKIIRKTSKTYSEAYEKTRKLVALPGNSEHQTGLALDIFSTKGMHRSNFEGTKEQKWLSQNSYKFGFIIRYPKNKTKETDSDYEPWHIRYVGIPLSSYLYTKNLCLEEFYDKIFAGDILENKKYVFLQIKDSQKIYIDQDMLSKAELESVKKGVGLLTLKKD